MYDELSYQEKITSNKTEALFVALMLLFFLLFVWRLSASQLDILSIVLLTLALVFLLYSLNYRTLTIRLTTESLKLTFGVFTWSVPLDNVADCQLDEIPLLLRLGGAGIHFMSIRGRYRASFNFLEYPRVVVAFKKKRGPVQDISFSTRQPEQVLRLIQAACAARNDV